MATDAAEWLRARKQRKIEVGNRQVLRGVPVEEVSSDLDARSMKLPFPIVGCLCVQDSPENPCPCKDVILWLPTFPEAVVRTQERNREGKAVFEFILDRNAVVFVDVQMPIRPVDLEKLARKVRRLRQRGSAVSLPRPDNYSSSTSGSSTTGLIKRAAPDFGWTGFAFAAGYAVGSVLDDALGSEEGGNDKLSDDLSDWAADNFPAPGWLQDLF